MYAVCRQAHPAVPSLRARRCVECVWVGSHVFFFFPSPLSHFLTRFFFYYEKKILMLGVANQ